MLSEGTTTDQPSDKELLDYLLSLARHSGPHMDGMESWHWTHSAIGKHYARSPREALVLAYQQHQRWAQEAKEIMGIFIKFCQSRGAEYFQKCQEMGPIKIMDEMLNEGRPVAFITQDYYDNVRANREEAERFLGALLGMM